MILNDLKKYTDGSNAGKTTVLSTFLPMSIVTKSFGLTLDDLPPDSTRMEVKVKIK